jgi:hypothetical protein
MTMARAKTPLTWYQLRWGPTMEKIGVVLAASPSKARRKAPKKYRKYLGEIDAEPLGPSYVTTYCNHAHRLSDGKPIDHNCYVLPPAALQLERDGKFAEAIEVLERAKPLRESLGLR